MDQGLKNLKNINKLYDDTQKLRRKVELSTYLTDSQKNNYYARLDEIDEKNRELSDRLLPNGKGIGRFFSRSIEYTLGLLETLNTCFNEHEKEGMRNQSTGMRTFNSTPILRVSNPEPNPQSSSQTDGSALDDTPNQNSPRRR